MSVWTTLEMAKKQVGVSLADTSLDDWLRQQLEIAEAVCLRFLQDQLAEVPAVPPDALLSGAIYLQFAELWRFRGDDPNAIPPASFIPGAPSEQVCRLLLARRPLSLA